MKHLANTDARKEQMLIYYGGLEKTVNGRLTRKSNEKWKQWVSSFGISAERARQIIFGPDSKTIASKPINKETAAKYSSYLRRYGYTVVEPAINSEQNELDAWSRGRPVSDLLPPAGSGYGRAGKVAA